MPADYQRRINRHGSFQNMPGCSVTLPANRIDLPPGDVHVWCVFLDEMDSCRSELEQTLSGEEQARANRFRLERDRARYVIGHGILRTILGSYLDVEPEALEFCCGINGKPLLTNRFGPETIRFNISRSYGLALYAFSRDRDLGVDIEKMKPVPEMDRIVAQFFNPLEIKKYYLTPANERMVAFFRCWTRKEAYLKATGDGLFRPLDTFSILTDCDGIPRIIHNGKKQEAPDDWTIRDLSVREGYVAAIAFRSSQYRLRCKRWPHPQKTKGFDRDWLSRPSGKGELLRQKTDSVQ